METLDNMFFFNASFWIRLGMALVCGSLIGLERERYDKPAGLRTAILICVGSCVFVMVQDMIARQGSTVMDHSRIVGQIVTGVGFLGAGAIIRQGLTVVGLTTAATIWVLAAIGAVIGIGFPYTAFVITVSVLIALIPMRWLERYIGIKLDQRNRDEGDGS